MQGRDVPSEASKVAAEYFSRMLGEVVTSAMPTEASKVAAECVRRTRANRISSHARKVALIAIMLSPDGEVDAPAFRKQIREEYARRYECGSVFLVIVLPILINLISAWIIRWLSNRSHDLNLRRLRTEAFDAL
jgi:hypothetical protein